MSKQISELNQEEIDYLSSTATESPVTDIAVWSALKKLPDSDAGRGDLPIGAVKGCQVCEEAIEDDDELESRFGHFYHNRCIP